MLLLHHRDGSTHARAANQFDAEVYLGIIGVDDETCSASFYETESFSSYGGRDIANLATDTLSLALRIPGQAIGAASPVLRQTRMPAVVFRLGPQIELEDVSTAIANGIHEAMLQWITNLEHE